MTTRYWDTGLHWISQDQAEKMESWVPMQVQRSYNPEIQCYPRNTGPQHSQVYPCSSAVLKQHPKSNKAAHWKASFQHLFSSMKQCKISTHLFHWTKQPYSSSKWAPFQQQNSEFQLFKLSCFCTALAACKQRSQQRHFSTTRATSETGAENALLGCSSIPVPSHSSP